MRNAVIALFASRKFLVLLFTQLALLVPAVFGKLPVDTSVEIAATLVGAWMASHAYEQAPANAPTTPDVTTVVHATPGDMPQVLP